MMMIGPAAMLDIAGTLPDWMYCQRTVRPWSLIGAAAGQIYYAAAEYSATAASCQSSNLGGEGKFRSNKVLM